MRYFSANEIAEKWDISSSRIRKLAIKGRVPGAQFIGNCWMFPENAKKPVDKRKKEVQKEEPSYKFPIFILGNYTEEDVLNFSEEERSLYLGQMYYCNCKFDLAKKTFEDLIKTTTATYIKIGTLYSLCLTYIFTGDTEKIEDALFSLRLLFEQDFEGKEELRFILEDLRTTFGSQEGLPSQANISFSTTYSMQAESFIVLNETTKQLILSLSESKPIQTSLFEIFAKNYETNEYFSPAICMNYYIGTMCQLNGKIEEAKNHFKKAIDLAIQTKFFGPLIALSSLNFDSFEQILKENHENYLEFFRQYHIAFQNGYSKFLNLSRSISFYNKLRDEDYKFVNYIISGIPNKQIAILENISERTVNKRLSSIYEKLSIDGKKQLQKLAISALFKVN